MDNQPLPCISVFF
jgi:hypothetical protein